MNPNHPFQLDYFQKQAIDWIERNHSVFVSAPTGSGKTVIAQYAIERALQDGKRAVYTAPIKALSNQKYRDFRAAYGEDQVGILTGDVSINAGAPILIMTTEIYRNRLFDNLERVADLSWLIMDEIHYLDDPERGTVWEEALLFTPEHVNILALSATVPNVHDLVEWIRSIHNRDIEVVEDAHRPVPLSFVFQCQNHMYTSMKKLRQYGYENRERWKLTYRDKRRGVKRLRAKNNKTESLLDHMIIEKHLPAIYFIFGRRRAEYLAWDSAKYDLLTPEERIQITEMYRALCEKYQITQERSAQEMGELIQQGIAFHHAGMLPSLKEVIEQLFTSRLIKLIFTTETFALGINMPARSVIFDELHKFYGTGFNVLTTRDFYQMAGRAGRRGIDTEGTVYVRIHPHDIPFREVERVLFSKPEMVRSQLNTTYATLLSLYKDLGWKLLDIYPKTFHYFQSSRKKRRDGFSLIERKLKLLDDMMYINADGLTQKGEFAGSLFGYELILAEMHQDNILEDLNEVKLSILLCSLIYEPRRDAHLPHLNHEMQQLKDKTTHYYRHVIRKETKYNVSPCVKTPYFHLCYAVRDWMGNKPFDQVCHRTGADEGELVRHFRMIIQLQRELMHAPHVSNKLKATAAKARDLINRDVVDAEKQLRV